MCKTDGLRSKIWAYIICHFTIIALLLCAKGSVAQYTTSDFSYYKDITLNADGTAAGTNTFVTMGSEQVFDGNPIAVEHVSITPVSCNGEANGSAILTISGGTEPYQITWNNGQTGLSLLNVAAGEYTATIIDNNGTGTTIIQAVTITEPEALAFTILNASEELCNGICDGMITYSLTGGVMPYTRSWEAEPISSASPSKEITFTGNEYLEDYQISFTVPYDADMQADFADLRFYLSSGESLSYWIEESTPSVSAKVWVKIPVINTGANSLTMTYGDSSLSSIESIESTMINGALQAAYYYYGSYTGNPVIDPADLVTVCIDNGTTSNNKPIDHDWGNEAIDLCGQAYDQYTLISWTGWLKKPDTATGDNFSLQGGSDDGFRLMLDGAPITNPTVSFWGARSYGTTTDDYTFTKDIVSLQFDFWQNHDKARATFAWDYPGGSGSYDIVPTENYYCAAYSANPPTDIVFSDELAATLYVDNGLCAGTNTYIVTDDNGCSQSQEYTITTDNTVPQILCAENFETPILPDWTYTISGNTLDATATDNCSISSLVHNYNGGGTTLDGKTCNSGTTTVTWTATDSNGNTSQCSQDITINTTLNFTGTITPISCYGNNDGKIELTILCGTPPYIISWSNGSTGEIINNLTPGTYTATITDNNGSGISVSKNFTVTEPQELDFTITPVTQYLCDATCIGSFEYQVNGGTIPYSLSWISSTTPIFKKQQQISFTGYETSSNYQLKVTIPYQSGMQSNFDDIRFKDATGTSLPYWIESYTAMVEATVWIKVNQIETGENTISLIYDAETATSESNLFNTMNSGGLRTKYYYMPGLSSAPTINETTLISECIDNGTTSQHRPIDHNWGSGAVDICEQTYPSEVIISWIGWLAKPDDATGDVFSLRIGSDDGSRVMLGDATRANPTVEYWQNRGYKTTTGSYTFTADVVPIIFDYYENWGNARVTFEWQYPGESNWEIVPQNYYYYAQYSANPPDNITIGPASAYTSNLQENLCAGTETYTITDASGCTASQTYTVMNEEEPPEITLTPSITINLANTCQFQISGTEYNATATDNCTLVSLVHDYDGGGTTLAGKTLQSGTTIIHWTATDNSGNTSVADQQFVVNTPTDLSISGAITNVQCPGNTDGAIDITVEDRGLLQFSETEGGVTIPDDPTLDLTTEGTLEAWIYPETIGKYSGIIQKGTSANNESYSLQFFESQLCLMVHSSQDDYEDVTSSATITLNTWHHVAGVWDADSLYLFLDGVKVATEPGENNLPRSTTGILRLGHQYPYSGAMMDFDGKIQDARIWNTAHSEAEIAQYRFEQPPTGNDLVASWPLDEGAGETVADISGNNLEGTIVEGEWTTPTFTYLWNNGATTEDISSLSAGTYTVTVTNEFGCSTQETFTVSDTGTDTEPPTITLAATPASVTANSGNNFIISDNSWDATATDNCALTSLTHNYLGGGTTFNGISLPIGTHTITWTATDESGNTSVADQQFVVNTPTDLSISGAITNVQCPGNTDGAIDITVEDRGLLQFSDAEGGVTIPDDRTLNLIAEGTLEAWIYPYTINNTSGIIQKGTDSNTESYSLQFYNSKLCMSICYSQDNYEDISTSAMITLNTWHHVAGVWDSDSLYLFLDGVKVSTGSINGHSPRNTDGIIRIGHQYEISGYMVEFNGKIQDARIWNTAHSEAEIAQYRFEQPPMGNGLVASWPLDEGTGVTVADISGNNLEGTIVEGEWITPTFTYLWNNGATTEDISSLSAGTYTVTVTNEFGYSTEETFTVSVTDTEPPTITLAATPASVTANSGNNFIISDNSWDATATDNCALTSLTHNYSGGGTTLNGISLPIGTHTIPWTATDESGNTSSESFEIAIQGAFAPGGVVHDLEIWLRADKQVHADISGTEATHNVNVAEWDGFSTIYNGTQTSIAAQPTYKTEEADQINYNGYLNFDGSDDNLIINHTGDGMESSNTIFLICKPDSEGALLQLGANSVILCNADVEYRVNNSADNTTRSSANTVPVGKWSLLSIVKTGDETGDILIFRQGEELGYQKTGNAAIISGSNIIIGSDNNSNNMAGNIAEVIIYNTGLSDADRKKVETYLAVKYGITL